jgi:rubrerythrin
MMYGFNAGEVFKVAIEIEENGRQFYEKASALAGSPETKKVFQELGAEEVKHKARFTELMNELPASTTGATVWDPDNEIDQYLKMMADMHVFRKADNVAVLLGSAGDQKAALKLAIQFEKDSIVFFAEMQTLAENAEGQAKIGQLVVEEQSHLRRLSLELRKLG